MWIIASIDARSQTNYTLTNLAEPRLNFSHNTINRYLNKSQFTPSLGWQNIQLKLKKTDDACVIFDDRILEQKFDNRYNYFAVTIAVHNTEFYPE